MVWSSLHSYPRTWECACLGEYDDSIRAGYIPFHEILVIVVSRIVRRHGTYSLNVHARARDTEEKREYVYMYIYSEHIPCKSCWPPDTPLRQARLPRLLPA